MKVRGATVPRSAVWDDRKDVRLLSRRKKVRKPMRRISSVLIVGMILVWAGAAVAGPGAWTAAEVSGEYAFSATRSCVVSTAGFDANWVPLTTTPGSKVWISTSSASGVQVFRPDGTGRQAGRDLNISTPPAAGASSGTFSFNFKYTVGLDGTIATVPGTYTGTFDSGPNAGQTITIAPWVGSTGMISGDGNTMTLSIRTPPVVETASVNGHLSYQICDRTAVLIRIGN